VVQIVLDLSQVISPLDETLRIAEPTFWGWAQVSLASYLLIQSLKCISSKRSRFLLSDLYHAYIINLCAGVIMCSTQT